MNRRFTCVLAASLTAATLGACADMDWSRMFGSDEAASSDVRGTSFSFANDELGRAPDGWTVDFTDGSADSINQVEWAVLSDATAHGDGNFVQLARTSSPTNTFNLLLNDTWIDADVEVRCWLRADSGEVDQGGGLVLRAKDANNYYIARWNPLESNLRLYRVVDGQRKMLKSKKIETDAMAWHELGFRAVGNQLWVDFDRTRMPAVQDDTFTEGGLIGLWTKADAATSFDQISVETLSP